MARKIGHLFRCVCCRFPQSPTKPVWIARLILLLCLSVGCRFHTEEELANIRNARAAEKQAKQKNLDSVIGSTITSIEDSSTLLKITLSDGRVIIVKNYKRYHSLDVKGNENAFEN